MHITNSICRLLDGPPGPAADSTFLDWYLVFGNLSGSVGDVWSQERGLSRIGPVLQYLLRFLVMEFTAIWRMQYPYEK